MKFFADFHIHSRFSLATSKFLTPEHLDLWGKIKGLTVIGTGDFTHPEWTKELKQKIKEKEPGLFKLKKQYTINNTILPKNHQSQVRFILSSEISTIYKKNNKVRKVHHIILAPNFQTVEKIQKKLQKIGNITSDGRPILKLDSRNLLEIILTCSKDTILIPAHIWTPWFSVFGSKSGFNNIKECFQDLSKYIYAIETGLSTDPSMNWQCNILNKYTLTSNSDAHSPEKLGRNANILNTNLSYFDIIKTIKQGNKKTFLGTIDLFPQEGKYYHDGHRKCNISFDPETTKQNNNICPICKKPLTIGVLNQINKISTKENNRKKKSPFYSIIPLKEILSEIMNKNPTTKTIHNKYLKLIKTFGTELDILLKISISEIQTKGHPIIAKAINRMRNKKVYIQEGFDGQYGKITLFKKKYK